MKKNKGILSLGEGLRHRKRQDSQRMVNCLVQ